tara:strand:- start:428 stop:1045 length:618 start_codon:yes stop_codon:yes gene_type:complete
MIETCCEIMKHSYDRNMITARDGNVSVRWESQPYWFITPAGVRKQQLQPAMWKKISVSRYENGDPIIMDYTPMSEKLLPSSEYPIHSKLQEVLPVGVENRVVMHLHPTYTTAAMHRGLDLHTLVHDFPELGFHTKVAVSVPDVPAKSQQLGDITHEHLELDSDGHIAYDIVGIKSHGVVSIAETPWRAFEHIERLEHICKIVLVS